jgi:ribonucleoside-diphosphate reductase alpha chain
MVVKHAHKTGDPGVVFIDRMNDGSPFDVKKHPEHTIKATNPCGEQPLEGYEACNLGSINLANFYVPEYDSFNFDSLRHNIQTAVMFLDDVVSSNVFPLQQITDMVNSNRKVGLGVMGWADLLIKLGVRYGSADSIALAESVMKAVEDDAIGASRNLASQRGCFPNWSHSKFEVMGLPQRNATLTTIAPTGTISMLADCSSGVEPIFAFAFTKTVMDGTEFKYLHPAVKDLLETGVLDEDDILFLEENGHFGDDPTINEQVAHLVGAMQVPPEEHVQMQAAFQKYTDNAVSKTVNLSNDATVEDIDNIYRLAYDAGLKGITIFRDGCRNLQVLTVGTKVKDQSSDESTESAMYLQVEGDIDPTISWVQTSTATPGMVTIKQEDYEALIAAAVQPEPGKRDKILWGPTIKQPTPCGNMYVTITEDQDGHLQELFGKLGKGGGCAAANMEAVGRLASVAIRAGVDPQQIVMSLRDIGCGMQCGFGPERVVSCLDAMGLALQRHLEGDSHAVLCEEIAELDALPQGPGAKLADEPVKSHGKISRHGACPECGGVIEHEGGCAVCRVCGYSKCA